MPVYLSVMGCPKRSSNRWWEPPAKCPGLTPLFPLRNEWTCGKQTGHDLRLNSRSSARLVSATAYSFFGAHTIEDFSSKIYSLVERPFSEDGGGWVMFDDELRKIVGLTLPEAKQPDRLPIGCSYFGLNYSGGIKPTGILSAGGLP